MYQWAAGKVVAIGVVISGFPASSRIVIGDRVLVLVWLGRCVLVWLVGSGYI